VIKSNILINIRDTNRRKRGYVELFFTQLMKGFRKTASLYEILTAVFKGLLILHVSCCAGKGIRGVLK